jgi:cyclopropane fatty-acyl-phospholipid synthase-like methyltransferase
MNSLKNWDNKTWLSSKKYINTFNNFLKSKVKLNKNSKILDVGCGRANIISYLHKQYKFNNKPIGLDVVKNKNIKSNIMFKKIDAIKYLNKSNNLFDLILIKQTIHFFTKKQIKILLKLAKNHLNKNGKIMIFSLQTINNEIPSFDIMKLKLNSSLKRDEILINEIKKNLKVYKLTYFQYKVNVSKARYIKMIKSRYISCLLKLSNKQLQRGVSEINSNYKKQIKFTDTLKCISYRK